MYQHRGHFYFFLFGVTFFCWSAQLMAEEKPKKILTRQEAFENLKKNGFKWRLTETLQLEAHGKTLIEKSTRSFKSEFVLREFAAKINPAQFGLENKVHTDLIGIGTTGLAFSYSLYDPAADLKILAAESQEEISKFQSKQYQHDLTALMLFQYVSVQKLERQLHAINLSIERAQLITKLAETKIRIGAGLSTDAARAKSLLESEQIKKLNIEIKLTKARHDFNQLLGVRESNFNLEGLSAVLINLPKSEQDDLRQAREQRYDFQLANRGQLAAQTAEEKLRSGFWPQLTLVGDLGSTDTSLFGLPGHSLGGMVGINLKIPLDSGGFLEGKRAETLALKHRAEINYLQAESELESQSKESRLQIKAGLEAVQAARNFVELSKQEMELAQKKYQAGSMNSLDVANALSNYGTSLDTETEALFNYEAARIQYYKTLGSFEEYFK